MLCCILLDLESKGWEVLSTAPLVPSKSSNDCPRHSPSEPPNCSLPASEWYLDKSSLCPASEAGPTSPAMVPKWDQHVRVQDQGDRYRSYCNPFRLNTCKDLETSMLDDSVLECLTTINSHQQGTWSSSTRLASALLGQQPRTAWELRATVHLAQRLGIALATT